MVSSSPHTWLHHSCHSSGSTHGGDCHSWGHPSQREHVSSCLCLMAQGDLPRRLFSWKEQNSTVRLDRVCQALVVPVASVTCPVLETYSQAGFIQSTGTAMFMKPLWFCSNFRCGKKKKEEKQKNKEGSGVWPRQSWLMGFFIMKQQCLALLEA